MGSLSNSEVSEIKDTRMTGGKESTQQSLRDGFARLGDEQSLDEFEEDK